MLTLPTMMDIAVPTTMDIAVESFNSFYGLNDFGVYSQICFLTGFPLRWIEPLSLFFSCPQVSAFLNVLDLLLKFIAFFTKVHIKPKKLAGHSVK